MDTERKRFLRFSLMNSVIIFAGLIVYIFLWNWIAIHVDLTPLQQFETGAVYTVQSSFGVPVEMSGSTTLHYMSPERGFYVEIIPLCTGIGEILFFMFLILLFMGVDWRTKAKGLGIFVPIIFIMNLLRLIFIHPLALWVGIEAMWGIHWFFWKYGTFAILMLFFSAWYLLFARKSLQSTLRITRKTGRARS